MTTTSPDTESVLDGEPGAAEAGSGTEAEATETTEAQPVAELDLAEGHFRAWLTSLGLDVEYTRAVGDTLYCQGDDGEEVAVLDCVGGYGSLILGHNHPQVVDRARDFFDAKAPVFAQFSGNPVAGRVAGTLDAILRRELGTDEHHRVVFANSGAEAIEAAIKHAELARVLRLQEVGGEIETHVAAARAAVEGGEAVVPADAYEQVGVDGDVVGPGFESLAAELQRRNAAVLARPPRYLALEGGFHGKLVGSLQLTHNPTYREPFAALAAQARFVPADDVEALRRIVDQERSTLFDMVVADGAVQVVERDIPAFVAFVVEPILGEGGIRPLSSRFAREVRHVCDRLGCHLIVDEIQTGMGRTGTFLASTQLGLRGDCYVLAKSLGGGLAKAAVILVRESRYRPELEYVHSSTFAKDGFSTAIALAVLELLEADDGSAYRLAGERGARLADMLRGVQADFPDVVVDVRGKGLMLGLELADQSEAASEPIRESCRSGLFGYTVAGYLFRQHRIRVFPTASATKTLRFEPSIYITDADIHRLDAALRSLCTLLRHQDGARLVS